MPKGIKGSGQPKTLSLAEQVAAIIDETVKDRDRKSGVANLLTGEILRLDDFLGRMRAAYDSLTKQKATSRDRSAFTDPV